MDGQRTYVGSTRPAGTELHTRWSPAGSRRLTLPRTGAPATGGTVPSDDELLARTLTFSGSYVSDDGRVSVRRSGSGSTGYSEARFVGDCVVCRRAGSLPVTGEPLADLRAAGRFVTAHDHGEVD